MAEYKWYDPDPQWRSQYDAAWTKIREKLGSYDKIAQVLFRETESGVVGQTVRRWQREGSLPVHWGATLVDLMEGDITLLDLFPYLESYNKDSFLD